MKSFLQIARGVRAIVRIQRRRRGPLRPTWDEEFETLATILHHYGKRSIWLPLDMQRQAAMAMQAKTDAVETTRFEPASAPVRAEWFLRDGVDSDRVLLYLHGGGYSIGSIDTHRDLICRLAAAAGARALAVDYRLAPEHPFPAQLDDAMRVYDWLLDQGVDPKRVVIAGESAGGGLTLSTLLRARDTDRVLPAGALVISPWVDLEATGGTMRTNHRYDYVSKGALDAYAKRFVRPEDLRNPLAAPLHADLSGLPPLLVQAGEAETLLDDSRRLTDRAAAAGVDVELEVEPDMIHAFPLYAPAFAKPREAIQRAGDFMRRVTEG